ncbi:MAG: methylated-DNA--[protein]-cysteine S-methyltransferase [Solirubrobacterales bacterium]|nr:methylated-DNA--[protein]-cysteine S-methyltransferase [Solirubrobacterales bacterium]
MSSDRSTPTDPDWDAIRARLASRAEREGLLDVAVERHESPLGELLIAATADGVARLGLPSEDEDEVLAELAARVSPRVLRASRPALADARHQLDEYFAGNRRHFGVDLDWRLTNGFRRGVLEATAAIPYGETGTYTSVATAAGSPAAVRAAGTALATNPIPILIPCHRVLRSDGEIGNYRGGREAKVTLLELEAGGR